MNIIKSDLVAMEYDIFWKDITPIVMNATPRPVLVLINESENNSQEDAQLLKMLDACKLAPEQYNIIRIRQDEQVAWHQLRDRLNPKIIFMIGILPVQLGISALFKLNQPNHFNDCVWLPTISIREQEQFPDVKKQLWLSGMKPVFVDKSFGAF